MCCAQVASSASVNVKYGGHDGSLAPGAAYSWNVTTWTGSSASDTHCASTPSKASRFVTALFAGWHKDAAWIWPVPLADVHLICVCPSYLSWY